MPKCVRCKRTKAARGFPPHNLKPGNRHWCRMCQRAYDREYVKRKPEKARAKEARYRAANTAAISARRRRYLAMNGHKKAARDAVRRAMLSGRLSRPGRCSSCRRACKPHAHHDSYLPAAQLKVKWLCRSCHARWHRLRGDYEPKTA